MRLVTEHVHANITRSWWLGTDDNATSSLNSNLLTSNIKFSTKHIYSCTEEVQNENTVIFGECIAYSSSKLVGLLGKTSIK